MSDTPLSRASPLPQGHWVVMKSWQIKSPASAGLLVIGVNQLPFTALPLTVPSRSMMLYSLPSVSTCCRRTSR
ncbi:hypothetical protein B0E42_08995 [Pseudomonas sp. A25(2017)]|nr:hypothetical protein B0E42_08995 [Pseudomonas sp. A25(2017)]